MPLSTKIYAGLVATLSGSGGDFGNPTAPISSGSNLAHEMESGTTTGKADKIFADQRTLAASATENLDLAGALTDPLGAALTFARVKAILIKAAAGNTNNVVVGGAGSNPFAGPFADATDKVAIPPGGVFLVTAPAAGWTVTAGTGDILLVANSGAGTPVTYDVFIVGTSA
jgi:hypothetical protein